MVELRAPDLGGDCDEGKWAEVRGEDAATGVLLADLEKSCLTAVGGRVGLDVNKEGDDNNGRRGRHRCEMMVMLTAG